MAREFLLPGRIFTGTGALEQAAGYLAGLGTKALIVTDSQMRKLGNCGALEQTLTERGIGWAVFDGVDMEPTDKIVEAGLACYHAEGCDFLVALGGGSPMDTMKAIGVLAAGTGRSISSYMGEEITVAVPPMVAIPTTAGTGSEATQFTIITDTERDIKMLLKGSVLMPSVAVADPRFTMTAPPGVTASTGLDALCHAVEAYTSRKAQPLSDTFARSAVERIFRALPAAWENGADEAARSEMSIAALEAGIAFNNASVTLIHGMSRPIGALFHIPHGLSNAMLMKTCLSYALPGAQARFAELGRAVDAAREDASDEAATACFLEALSRLTAQLEIPTLEQYGVDRQAFFAAIDKMAHDAMESGSPQNTMRDLTEADIRKLYTQLW